jgi:motility quorum-sensing regulator/GCU-specific mRNA interferase toxin
MEKAVAHYRLFEVKQRVEAGLVRATASAFRGARDLGIENLSRSLDYEMPLLWSGQTGS